MLPANKILIGTDTGTAEAFLGTVRLTRSLLADVLEEKAARGTVRQRRGNTFGKSHPAQQPTGVLDRHERTRTPKRRAPSPLSLREGQGEGA